MARTKSSIDHAFHELLERRRYEALSVADVVRKADVGRATFYAHYDSKDDLLRSQLGAVFRAAVRLNPSGGVDATRLFAHVREVPLLHQGVVANAHGPTQALVREVLADHLRALRPSGRGAAAGAAPAELQARLAATALLTLLDWWVERGMPETPEALQMLYQGTG